MENLKSEIKALLKNQFFISSGKKKDILSKLDNLSENKINKLLELLKKSDISQSNIISKSVKENPNFLNEVQGIVSNEMMKNLQEKEEIAIASTEIQLLESLEVEIDNF